MAIDNKYGRVTLERGDIGEDEPVVVFRAKDELLGDVLDAYSVFCEAAGSSQRHLDLIGDTSEKIRAWQNENGCRTPQSASLAPE